MKTNLWFTSDTHFGHKNILEFCPNRPGKDIQEMNEALIRNWNSCVQPDDDVYHLGDFMMGQSLYWESTLNRLQGNIHLVAGNHDRKFKKQPYVQERMVWIRDYYELRVKDEDALNSKNQLIVMQHYAPYVWNENHKGAWALCGHSHGSADLYHRLGLSLDVGVDAENSNYFPISYTKIKQTMARKVIHIVDHHS